MRFSRNKSRKLPAVNVKSLQPVEFGYAIECINAAMIKAIHDIINDIDPFYGVFPELRVRGLGQDLGERCENLKALSKAGKPWIEARVGNTTYHLWMIME